MDSPVTLKPAAAPEPPVIVPAQIENIAVAIRAPKNGTIKEDEGRVAVGSLLPYLWDQRLVFPESLEDFGVEPNVIRRLQTPQSLFTFDPAFVFLEHMLKSDIGKIHLSEDERVLILLVDGPSFTDKLGGVERLRTVYRDDLLADDDFPAILEEGGKIFTRPTRIINNPLQDISVQRTPIDVVSEDRDDVVRLNDRYRLTHGIPPSASGLLQ